MADRPIKGFTLIELLVVIAIIGVLSTVVLASLQTARDRARVSAGKGFDANTFRALGSELLGNWTFDDCSGTNVTNTAKSIPATLTGSVTWDSDTPYGRGCSLLFSGGYVSIDAAAGSEYSIQPGTARTFTAWFKADPSAATQTVLWKNGACIGWSVSLSSSGRLNGSVTVGSGCGGYTSYNVSSLARFDDGKWHHAAIVVDRVEGKLKLYGDGTLLGEVAIDTTSAGSGGNFRVGTNWDATTPLAGRIDEVRAYGTSLTLSKVRELYAAGYEHYGLVVR